MIDMSVMTVKAKGIKPEKKVGRQTRKGRPAQFYASDEFFALVEEWRATQRPVPTMSEAFRTLIETHPAIQRFSKGKGQ
jgi:hypothetical protein